MSHPIFRPGGTAVVDGNGWLGVLSVDRADAHSGAFTGRIYNEPVRGRWDSRSRRITFVRSISSNYAQHWEGFSDARHVLRGTFQEEVDGELRPQRSPWCAAAELVVEGNGHRGALVIHRIDAAGAVEGRVYDEPIVDGRWDQSGNRLSFTRASGGTYRQHWTGSRISGLSLRGHFTEAGGGTPGMQYEWHSVDPAAKKVAFVLSGGGSKGDFQVGALTALQEAGIHPDIVCGTSVGALNALMLAQGDNGLAELRRIWLGLRRNDHMWLFEEWWQDVDPTMRHHVVAMMLGEEVADAGAPWSVPTGTLVGAAAGAMSAPGVLIGALVGAVVSGVVQTLHADAFRNLLTLLSTKARALLNLNPTRALMAEHFDLTKFADFVRSGKQLRLAVVGLESGELCYVTEAGELLRRDGISRLAGGIPILDGALASASIGTVFPPVNFAGDAWVDGGHRECMPIQAALEAGATEVYVISASPVDRFSSINRTEDAVFTYLGADRLPPTDFETRKILDIASRSSMSIHLDEMAADDVYPWMDRGSVPITLIAPEYSTHDLVTIDPELIRVNYDYGYRTAWDTLKGLGAEERSLSSTIALALGRASRLRKVSWRSVGVPFSSEIGTLEAQAAAARQARVAKQLPVGAPLIEPISRGHDLQPGEVLLPDQSIRSLDRAFTMVFQASDGNLVVRNANGQVTWASNAYGFRPAVCVMQRDGNLVVYDEQWAARWSSGTSGHRDAVLRLQNDGVLTLSTGVREVWRSAGAARPSSTPQIVTIRNTSPCAVIARFHLVSDPIMGGTLQNGEIALASGSEATWTFPTGLTRAKLVFNARPVTAAEVIPGQTIVFSEDQRVRINNPTEQVVEVKVFNADAWIPGGLALPGGAFSVPPRGDAFYEVPADVDRVRVLLNNRQEVDAFRGSTVTYAALDFVRLRNDASEAYEFLVYKPDDTAFAAALPGGIFVLQPNGDQRHFPVPADVRDAVTVRVRRPPRFPDLFPRILHTARTDLGKTLVLQGNLGVAVDGS